jgi:N-methylhydantoinase A
VPEATVYRMGIDVGGTFTDLALFDAATGELRVTKAPTTPQNPAGGVTAVINKAGLEAGAVVELIHGTTVATNALLERKKATPGLITTRGFRDLVFIQRMNRKHHYDLQWDKPQPYVERRHCLEVDERTNYKGDILVPLDEASARTAVLALRDGGIRDIAVAFLFSYVDPTNELRMRDLIREVYPEATVSLSHEVYPRWREYDRVSTTLADAFLKSLVAEYLSSLAEGLAEQGSIEHFLVMKSNGGVESYRAAAAKPVDLLVSGPVGGVLSAMFFGRLTERPNLITMDMGGTSFDVSMIEDGKASQATEFEIEWGLPVYTPMVDVKTIGAGGGSIAWIDKGGLLRVGPQSAGSNPGPACYGRGGTEPTVTDANLVLGRLNPGYFLGGELALDHSAAHRAVARLAEKLGMGIEEVASSIVELVDFNMVNAIRLVSIDRGLDPRRFTLVSFGGAGSLHAAALAEIIGIEEILIPVHQGVFSAFGLMTADMRVDESITANFRSDLVELDRVNDVVDRLRVRALERLRSEGYEGTPILEENIEMRYLGQNHSTDISIPRDESGRLGVREVNEVFAAFHAEHKRLYGYEISDEIIEFVHFKVTAIGPTENPILRELPPGPPASPKETRDVYFRSEGGWLRTPIYSRDSLPPGSRIEGPAMVEEAMATTLMHPGQSLEVDRYGNITLTTAGGR